MSKLAIDVAILPSEEIMDICIDLNKKDSAAFSHLNKTDNFPHLTLAMGIMDKNDFEKVAKIIQKEFKKFFPLNLEINKLNFEITPENKKSMHFATDASKKLVDLHQEIMNNLSPILSYKVESGMFFKKTGEKINEISKFWVGNYAKKYSGLNNYYPHISLKCRNAEYNNLPIKFVASKLAICQLGNYCTCRKILKEFKLE